MTESTRRGFLGMAGAGAAAAGVASIAPRAVAAPGAAGLDPDPDEPVVAYLEDGRLSLMVGEREVAVDDPELVRRLRRAAGR